MHAQISVRTRKNKLSTSTGQSILTHCNLPQNLMSAFRQEQEQLQESPCRQKFKFSRQYEDQKGTQKTSKSKCKDQRNETFHETNLVKYGYTQSKVVLQVCNYPCNLKPRITQFHQKIYEITGKANCQRIGFFFHFPLTGHPSTFFWQSTTFSTLR